MSGKLMTGARPATPYSVLYSEVDSDDDTLFGVLEGSPVATAGAAFLKAKYAITKAPPSAATTLPLATGCMIYGEIYFAVIDAYTAVIVGVIVPVVELYSNTVTVFAALT